ncbi:Uncharacterised protein [Mycobacteroides abscessus subsp. massiliense]|uniref:Secreted protein n=1 Tax=Mycobacteroides abscessus subsp. bolletii 50594 TaxID=1303024 RepID=A0AB33A4E9_9MYCO|nr:hypothetical protein MASS_0017 [Mycobacteroides abscessus subsp. bolletii 50594]EHB97127.1 hypothetical protein MAB47J26_21945 [Mycobacteroides abscessus 47J26]CPZ28328.1 Uncharacterised protein [Mycobacteroides abscessus]SKN06426.1 Uncharacterised protein [Mycobacteroides abscessus subsp. massiliense]
MTVRGAAAIAATIGVLVSCACNASADPLKFPDIASYTPVNIRDFEVPFVTPGRQPIAAYYFRTPDGIACRFFDPPSALCLGNNLPGVPPAPSDPAKGINGINSISTNSGLTQANEILSPESVSHYPTLPAYHSITVNGVICGVDDKGTTACKDPQGRGFVLSKQGSGWIPKI